MLLIIGNGYVLVVLVLPVHPYVIDPCLSLFAERRHSAGIGSARASDRYIELDIERLVIRGGIRLLIAVLICGKPVCLRVIQLAVEKEIKLAREPLDTVCMEVCRQIRLAVTVRSASCLGRITEMDDAYAVLRILSVCNTYIDGSGSRPAAVRIA